MKVRNVCNCNEVSERAIIHAIKNKGARTVDDLRRLTRAGGDCGKCKPLQQSILDRELPLLSPNDQLELKFPE